MTKTKTQHKKLSRRSVPFHSVPFSPTPPHPVPPIPIPAHIIPSREEYYIRSIFSCHPVTVCQENSPRRYSPSRPNLSCFLLPKTKNMPYRPIPSWLIPPVSLEHTVPYRIVCPVPYCFVPSYPVTICSYPVDSRIARSLHARKKPPPRQTSSCPLSPTHTCNDRRRQESLRLTSNLVLSCIPNTLCIRWLRGWFPRSLLTYPTLKEESK